MENEYTQLVNELLQQLEIKNDQVNYNGQFGIKCPYCGHTDRTRTSTHLYIKMTNLNGSFPYYNCVKCGNHGSVTESFLQDLGIDDPELKYQEGVIRTELKKRVGGKGFKKNRVKPLKILPPLNNKFTRQKIDYIEKRLGIKLTTKDIINKRIIMNLKDFLKYIQLSPTRHEMVIDLLDEKYVGFLSTSGEFIHFRKIDNNFSKYEKRYMIYNVFGLEDNTNKIYTLSEAGKVNVMEDIHVIMAEGCFDILGIINHIYDNKIPKNTVFVAVTGMGYTSSIKYLNRLGMLFANYEIYSDNTVPLTDYRKMIKDLEFRIDHLTVNYNKLYKDCGVPKDMIKIKSYDIL